MNNKLTTIYLAVFCLIIIAPPLVYGYIYPTTGDDSAMHLRVIDVVSRGETTNFAYFGQAVTAHSISALNKWFGVSVDDLFLWFNYLALVAIGATLYYVLTKLVNRWAALLVIPLAIFCTQSILKVFQCGTIFHIINMYVILPLAIYFMVKWLTGDKVYQAVISLGLFSLFSVFHTTALYLPFAIGLFFVLIIAYKLLKRNRNKLIKIVGFGTTVIGLNLVLSWPLLPSSQKVISEASKSVVDAGKSIVGLPAATPIYDIPKLHPTIAGFLASYLGFITLFVLAFSIAVLIAQRGKIKWSPTTKLLITSLVCFVLVLTPIIFMGLGPDPIRLALDLATIIAIITACLVGMTLTVNKKRLIVPIYSLLILVGVLPSLMGWFSYNSSMEHADIQTIEYLNRLDGRSYSCSTQVAPWIYNRWLEKDYLADGEGDFVIYRTKPMTARTDSSQFWFQYEKASMLADYDELVLIKKFGDGEVEVYVFSGE